LWVFSTKKFFTQKFLKTRWCSYSFGSFAHHFLIKLSTHGSNPTLREREREIERKKKKKRERKDREKRERKERERHPLSRLVQTTSVIVS
jgi:hypothetical protein